MNCKEFRDLIPAYIDDEMDSAVLGEFVKHVDLCYECRDELEVNYLVKEGLSRLEEGNTFDFKRELDLKLSKSRRTLVIASRARMALVIVSAVLAIILIAVVLGIIIL